MGKWIQHSECDLLLVGVSDSAFPGGGDFPSSDGGEGKMPAGDVGGQTAAGEKLRDEIGSVDEPRKKRHWETPETAAGATSG